MIVDDDRSARLIIKTALKQSTFDILETTNGSEALELFVEYQPDLVLLDVIMPQIDGFEACRRIRTFPNGETVPIILMTASDDFEAIAKAYDAGATDFFAKPITPQVLRERLRYMLRASATTKQLHRSQELLSKAQAVAALGSFSYEPGSPNLEVSEEFLDIIGPVDKNHPVTWDVFWEKIHPQDKENLTPFLEKAYHLGTNFKQDIRLVGHPRGERFVMLQIDPETNSDGNVLRLIGIIQDITERKLSELYETDQNFVMQSIVRKEPLRKILFEIAGLLERQRPQSLAALCQIEENQIQMMLSPSLPEHFCQSMAETVLSPNNGTCAAAAYLGEPAVADNVTTSPFWKNRQKEALSHGFYSSASVPVFSGKGQILGTVCMLQRRIYHANNEDLDLMKRIADLIALAMEQKNLSRQLVYQASHDPLTGLINRGALIQWIAGILKQYSRKKTFGAYMLIDLDRFKHINDSLGHHLGDLLLQDVAERLRHCLRDSDLLSRVGGDEFVVILPEIKEEEDAVRAALRILDSFKLQFSLEEHKLSVGASIGITLFPKDAEDEINLHKNADIAMYVAKNEGGNRFHFFNNEMHEAVMQRLQIENDLRKALERDEFELHYQPQLDLKSDKLMVLEALIRWNHPVWGRILPAHFIPVAEDSRLIIPIGKWVIQEACRQNKAWQEQGFAPIRVAVNVSAIQFTETDFAKIVQEALSETRLDPFWLEVEITETVVLKDLEKANANLYKLRELGVTTTLDDFGTGYSSITYLSKLPLDGIKIDRSFIRDLEISPTLENGKNVNFMKAFATLAQNLNLSLVAEGVETEDQCNCLKNLGYTIGQGFLFSMPLPANEIRKFLQSGPRKSENST